MTNYEIIITKKAGKELALLPKKYYLLIVEHIYKLAQNPYPPGSIKLKGFEGIYRVRVGVYRIIYKIENDVLTIEIIAIGHRKDVYG